MTRILRIEWAELGVLGRSAMIFLTVSAVVAIILAVAIPHQAEHFILEEEAKTLSRLAAALQEDGFIPTDISSPLDFETLDHAVEHHLFGHEAVRVNIWFRDGTVAYSDSHELIGTRFEPSADVAAAFRGEVRFGSPGDSPEDATADSDLGPLREFYIPVRDDSGAVVAVYEVYELSTPLQATISGIRRYVWLSLFTGIGLLGLFVGSLTLANARRSAKGRQQVERLFGDLVRAQDEERMRIVGALHDDIGQPLYRIHYGIQDCTAHAEPGTSIEKELVRVGALVREADKRLRSELRALSSEPQAEIDLLEALRELGLVTEIETDLVVAVETGDGVALPPACRAALYRAAKEALTNVRKHALATRVTIRVHRHRDFVYLDVIDDGVGVVGDSGLGITTNRERLEALGGGLTVKQAKTGGTRFRAWLPADDTREAG
ncbi:MAG: sensor histidine kinase [Acidimicrobiia bacterium]